MPSEEAKLLAESRRGMVIAPAGCGKTFLLAEAVAISSGRQLVLTHTHAGVRAIRTHLEQRAVPTAKYRVTTIDGFALRYASAYPALSQLSTRTPSSNEEWIQLRDSACRVLERMSIKRVVSASYEGVFVDEYQDCSTSQHRLVLHLADSIPVRIVGDPLQAIFSILDRRTACPWKDVLASYPKLGELRTPHRWNGRNDSLGSWLLDVREKLIAGQPIDLKESPVDWKKATEPKDRVRVNACFSVRRDQGHSIIALRKWRPQCHQHARNLNGLCRAMETVECDELLAWCDTLESANGVKRVIQLLKFAELCISRLPATVKKLGVQLDKGAAPKPRREDYLKVVHAATAIEASDDLLCVIQMMDAIELLNESLVFARQELWRAMKKTLREHRIAPAPVPSIRQTAWSLRNRLRYVGRKMDRGSLATPLLVKGLEFDHAVVLDADEHSEAESLYVAITRGSRSLTLVSESPILQRPLPAYLSEPTEPVV